MAIKTAVVTVATTATLLTPAPGSSRTAGFSVTVHNPAGQVVYLGGSDVTTANGFILAVSTTSPIWTLEEDEQLYGIVAATTQAVRVLRTSS